MSLGPWQRSRPQPFGRSLHRTGDPMMERFCGMPFTGAGIRDVLRFLETRRADEPFGYLVTPNVDHVVRNWRDGGDLVRIYDDAELSLCDSRIVSLIGRLCGVRLPVVTGSDLTAILLEYLIDPYERLTIIGGSEDLIGRLARRYGLRNIVHHNPPMGFVRDPVAVLEASQFVERNPARFVFLAVGSPQQEILAQAIRERGHAHGLGLCVGASLLFLTGDLKRAPVWMQKAKLEWLFRLLQEPSRMWRRYLYEGPKILRIAADHMAQRGSEPQRPLVSVVVPTFRHEELLPRLLEHCAAQEGLNPAKVEILVVDTAPEASARGVVERVTGKSRTPIRYLHAPSAGDTATGYQVLNESQGEFIVLLDEGGTPVPAWLESLLMTQRVYGADVVLGPVRPEFEAAPRRYQASFTGFFARSSEAATGTSIEPASPLGRRRSGICIPPSFNNALLRRSLCSAHPALLARTPGPTRPEPDLLFQQLHREGERFVWCAEAVVTEWIPSELLSARALLGRQFQRGRSTVDICLQAEPTDYRAFALWLLIGLAQVIGGSLQTLLWPVSRERGFDGLCRAANGLGKLCSWPRGRVTAAIPQEQPV